MATNYLNIKQTTTEELTEIKPFDKVEFSSNEVFDNDCEICCGKSGKEAVGFCMSCDIYMCSLCIKHHKKIPLSQNHDIIGKEKFEEKTARKGLFERVLIPFSRTEYPAEVSVCIDKTYQSVKNVLGSSEVLQVHCIPGSKDLVFLMYQHTTCIQQQNYLTDVFELGRVDEKLGYKGYIANFTRSVINYQPYKCTQSNSKCEKEYVYFIFLKPSKVLAFCKQHLSVYEVYALPVGGIGYDVVPFNKGLALCMHLRTGFNFPEWQIHLISLKGEVTTAFYYDRTGKPLFKEPKHLASNHTQDVLYISDRGDNSIKALDTKGTVLFCYIHETLLYPMGITCDEENNIYVACGNKVIQIDKHGNKSRVMLTAEGQRQITKACYNESSNCLTIVDDKRQITTFKFLP